MLTDRPYPVDLSYADRAEDLQAQALEYAETARAQFSEGCERVKEYVHKEPARALGIALGVGVVVGWLIKRR